VVNKKTCMKNQKYTEEEQQTRAQFYSFTAEELKEVYNEFSKSDNFTKMKLALEILEQSQENLVILPVKNAWKILTSDYGTLKKSLKKPENYTSNTLSLIHYELNSRANNSTSSSGNISTVATGCIGSLSVVSIILIIIVISLLSFLGILLSGIFEFGNIFIKSVVH
jgi:hypothetical protein